MNRSIRLVSLVVLLISLLSLKIAFANDDKPPVSQCPSTKVVGELDDCLECHVTGKNTSVF